MAATARASPGKADEKRTAPVAAQKVGEATLETVNAGAPYEGKIPGHPGEGEGMPSDSECWETPGRADMKRAEPVAAKKLGEATQAAKDAGAPPARANKKMVTPMATQKVGKASPEVVDMAVRPGRDSKKIAAPVTALKGEA
jgi:hypothetical protein